VLARGDRRMLGRSRPAFSRRKRLRPARGASESGAGPGTAGRRRGREDRPDRDVLPPVRDRAPESGVRRLDNERRGHSSAHLSGPEYGPADGAAVELSDSFTVAVEESGYVTAARVESAGPDEEEDAREFVRTLARLGRIAQEDGSGSDARRLYEERKSHFVAL